ncbi:C2 calcium-dependent domain-containing protein 4A [Sciurus carolinensis]|uniref:C2 calcium-dependent domain-containing protein 4A n=1 Tax=Sciurus carolinensis TaxID=30640 RepID=A0AA41NFT8_SCICA|nr:C2 calcium-dependent domain-containing protein 4A-like [Sciurus carolinensis]MBZ3889122.1 C2 calcium-dependent domain-containing protein 4A [Sciurus carolinensis]
MRLLGKLRSSAPEPAFSNVLTPGRIPEFCIPPRLSLPCPPESPPAAALPRRCAAEPDLWPRAGDEGAGLTDWDPRSQAALSLPHLPRTLTAYGFCTLLESPHTRRKESLFLGDPRAAALLQPPAARPRVHTYGGNGGRDVPRLPLRTSDAAPATAPDCPCPPRDALSPRPCGRRLLRAPNGLLSRALRARRSRGLARARSVSNQDDDEERGSASQPQTPAPPCLPSSLDPRTKLVEAEGMVALGRPGCALRLAADYCPGSGRLRIRLLRAEGLAGGTLALALGCRISLVLQLPGSTSKQRSSVLRRSLKDAFDQDFCFDGLTVDQVRHLTVRVKAENKGRGLERGRLLGQGELLLGSLLLL